MNIEYERILNLNTIDNLEDNSDLYSELMNKETKVIEMVNRVVNQKQKESEESYFKYSSINTIVFRVFKVFFGITNDLMNLKNLDVVFRRERLLYLGILIVFVSLCFIVLYKIDK